MSNAIIPEFGYVGAENDSAKVEPGRDWMAPFWDKRKDQARRNRVHVSTCGPWEPWPPVVFGALDREPYLRPAFVADAERKA